MTHAQRTANRIAFLARSIASHARNRDAQIAMGVNAEWIDAQNDANVAELRGIRHCYNDDGSLRAPGADVDLDAEERRMGRLRFAR